MEIRYDASADAAYISFLGENEDAAFGFTYGCDTAQIGGQIHLDFDADGRLIGIEVLQAGLLLPKSCLAGRST